MRTPLLLCLAGLLALGPGLGRAHAGADLRHFDDAPLRAVQFLDAREGWAVGDDGVVWHSLDGGRNWERQPTGVRASLRSVCFLDSTTGFVAGREELPGGGSTGVLLHTGDGGWTWKRLLLNALPGLHVVKFVNDQVGYLAGEGSDQYPTGVFQTLDGGHTWKPVPGSRATCWHAADFDAKGGALGGAWNRLATLRAAQLSAVDMDTLGGRGLRGLQLRGEGGVAVGQGGLVLLSNSRGSSWHYADLKLSPEVRTSWDFHAVAGIGSHVWAVGRPGSSALHSGDGGKTWEVVRTGQPLPLHGIFFRDDKYGWAVGELGTIVATADGGKTWTVQRRGGQRAAVLFLHARAAGAPLDTVALLGGQEGYLSCGLCVTAPDPASAELKRCASADRFAAAFRAVGGAGGDGLWQFPLASHAGKGDKTDLLQTWNRTHGGQAAACLLEQVVQAIRTWKPEVILTDCPDASSGGADALVAEAVRTAFDQAGDPGAFAWQRDTFGLEVHKPAKLYAVWSKTGAHLGIDLTTASPELQTSPREFAEGPWGLLAGAGQTLPAERSYRLLASRLEGASAHRDLMQGVSLAPGGLARRMLAKSDFAPEVLKGLRQRANLRALSETPLEKLTDPGKLLCQIGPLLAEMPDDQAAPAAFAVARQYARAGQWTLAREAFLLVVDRYPAHPLALDALRWLMAHNSSSEARRRHELGQFLVVSQVELGLLKPKSATPEAPPSPPSTEGPESKKGKFKVPQMAEPFSRNHTEMMFLSGKAEARKWYQGCLEMAPRLAGFGPQHASDPAVQFCLQAARRNLSEVEQARQWYAAFAGRQPEGPWRSAALAELWLLNRTGEPPRPVLTCGPTDTRPYLDGKLDDECWQGAKPVRLVGAAGDTLTRYPTEVRLRHDQEFVYVGVRCHHPSGEGAEPAGVKTRDADLRGSDRISLMLDLDRDYSTCFHFQVDASGRVAEDCWGDRSWNPRWFVAIHREPAVWTAELAIPLPALTGDLLTPGRTWAANVVRVLPGKGVQAVSLPAEAPEESLRPEGMGLLIFLAAPRQAAGR